MPPVRAPGREHQGRREGLNDPSTRLRITSPPGLSLALLAFSAMGWAQATQPSFPNFWRLTPNNTIAPTGGRSIAIGTTVLLGDGHQPVDVTRFGAKCDGFTDDASAINAAISAAQNGWVSFPAAVCIYNSNINITGNTTLTGQGAGDPSTGGAATSLKTYSAAAQIHIASGSDRASLRNLALYSVAASGSADAVVVGDADATNGAGNFVVSNVFIRGFKGSCINVRNGNAGLIENSEFVGCGKHAVLLSSQQTGSTNTNAWRVIGNSAYSNGGDGFHYGKASQVYSWGNVSEGNGGYCFEVGGTGDMLNDYAESCVSGPLHIGPSGYSNEIKLWSPGSQSVVSANNANQVFVRGSTNSDQRNSIAQVWNNGEYFFPGAWMAPSTAVTIGSGKSGADSVTPLPTMFNASEVNVTDSTNFNVNAPLGQLGNNQFYAIWIENTGVKAMGTITWNSVYQMAPWVNPAPGYSRLIMFRFEGGIWIEAYRSWVDIPNSGGISRASRYPAGCVQFPCVVPGAEVNLIGQTAAIAWTNVPGTGNLPDGLYEIAGVQRLTSGTRATLQVDIGANGGNQSTSGSVVDATSTYQQSTVRAVFRPVAGQPLMYRTAFASPVGSPRYDLLIKVTALGN